MSRDVLIEKVAPVTRRGGDVVLAGTNNSTIILGRDRLDSVDSGYGDKEGAGSINMVVGRKGTDLSPSNDAATMYVSQKNDPDVAAGTTKIGKDRKGVSAAFCRADCVRITARTDVKIAVGKAYISIDSSGNVTIDADSITLGEGASDRGLLTDKFAAFWSTVVLPVSGQQAGPPPPLPPSIFSQRVKLR